MSDQAPGRSAPTPKNRESVLALEELFFSRTDRKGIIASGNEVFMRVSGYEPGELIGRAHNTVRHPEMPRAVFHAFWEYLQAGRPIAAYVKNLASDGSFYWVMAVAVPLGDGYISVRLKPSSPLFETAKALYDEVRFAERQVEGDNPRLRKEAIAAGRAKLAEGLRAAGFPTYDDFMHAALPAELLGREAQLQSRARVRLGSVPPDSDPALRVVLESTTVIHDFLERMVGDVERYAVLNRTLPQKARFLLDLAEEIRLFSLNARIAASRLNEDGATLGAIAGMMRSRSDEAGPKIEELNGQILSALGLLGDMGFRIAASKLEAEMLMHFLHELLVSGDTGSEVLHDLAALVYTLEEGLERLFKSLDRLDESLPLLLGQVGGLEKDLEVIRTLVLNGRIEAVRNSRATAVRTLFETIGSQVHSARSEMAEFGVVGGLAGRSDKAAERKMRAELAALKARLDSPPGEPEAELSGDPVGGETGDDLLGAVEVSGWDVEVPGAAVLEGDVEHPGEPALLDLS